ncbi:Ankyrin repeat-containing protein [Cynara cardunculus var. scolymus]|uniref:Ankyrin repeat-containing protein n=1 Tax=Cynara cardunculus var. scolymus TaxID=59895 RepID=A0A118JSK5_CYNCS|nr:Ankyrin repeat-containing protein [Cynara cardunculus var. scolymus]
MADLSNALDVSAHIEDLKYLYASNVNVSNFVSVKLSGDHKYLIWKAQMLCLMESHKMRGIVDTDFDSPGAMTKEIKEQYDSLLKGWIFGSLSEDVLTTVIDLESARAVWRKLKSIYDPDLSSLQVRAETEIVTVSEIETENKGNTKRNKKLRKATVESLWWEAEAILKNDKDAATRAISNDGNTMLHLAVGIGQNDFVEKLMNFINDERGIEKKNSNGHTALHIAAIVGNKYAAELLVKKRKELLGISDHKAYVPLLSAYYNMQLNTFVYLLEATQAKQQPLPLGLYPGSGARTGINLLVTAIFTKQYDLASTLVNIYPELATIDDNVLLAIAKTFPSMLDFEKFFIYLNFCRKIARRSSLLFYSMDFLYTKAKDILWALRSSKNKYYSWLLPEMVMILLVPAAAFYPIYQLFRLLILVLYSPFFMLYFLLWKVLATVVGPIKRIEKKKKEYKEAKEILNSVCDQIDKLSFSGTHHPSYSRPILEAACQGAYEVVDEILFRSPKAIDCKNQNGHNIIQLAVLNRSEKVYNLIYHIVERKDFYRTIIDASKNNLLHLAGRLAPSRILSRTTGAALQLQRELQWRETPEMLFTREHKYLVKEGEKWMKTTAESCNITAALITTIVFAAAITVPGGSNQETGTPLFKKKIAFTIFAVSDAISLFASATALLVFLSILTARFSEQDFLVSLPRRLIVGLCTLFLSTTAMMVAFGATLFLVFCDQREWMLAPIGGLACLPIVVFVTLQFPLVVDLFRSTYFPIFGKQKYIDGGKFDPNDIQSFFGNLGVEYVLE